MNIKKAVSIISRQAPCRHESYELVGHSGEGICNDCGAYFVINSNRHTVAAEKFDDAIDFLLSLDKEAPVLTETVEVKIWAYVDSTNGRVWSVGNKEQIERSTSPDSTNLIKIVELTGTYEREIKPKVKRRKVAGTFGSGYDAVHGVDDTPIPADAKLIFEWEE